MITAPTAIIVNARLSGDSGSTGVSLSENSSGGRGVIVGRGVAVGVAVGAAVGCWNPLAIEGVHVGVILGTSVFVHVALGVNVDVGVGVNDAVRVGASVTVGARLGGIL